MKNQLVPPDRVRASPVPLASEYVFAQKWNPYRGTELSGELGGRGSVAEVDRFLLARDFLHGEAGGGGTAIHQDVEAAVDPGAGLGAGEVGLVLDVGLLDFERAAEQAAAEILDGHFDGDFSAGAVDVAVGSGDVAEQADLDGGGLRADDRGAGESGGGCGTERGAAADCFGHLF